MNEVNPEVLLEQLDGATIVASHVEDENGLHFSFADGRVLVICGHFGISLVGRTEKGMLH